MNDECTFLWLSTSLPLTTVQANELEETCISMSVQRPVTTGAIEVNIGATFHLSSSTNGMVHTFTADRTIVVD